MATSVLSHFIAASSRFMGTSSPAAAVVAAEDAPDTASNSSSTTKPRTLRSKKGSVIEIGHISDADAYEEDINGHASEDGSIGEEESDKRPPPQRRGPSGRFIKTAQKRANHDIESDEESNAEISNAAVSEDEDDDAPWEAESKTENEDASEDGAEGSKCIYCAMPEDEDPGEEFEDYLTCHGCSDNAHRHCARNAGTLTSDEKANLWKCDECIKEDDGQTDPAEEAERRRRSTTNRLTRDLLPVQKGVQKPGSHSVFNTLILDDDPMDGSRSLRKRKASTEVEDKNNDKKRIRRSGTEHEIRKLQAIQEGPPRDAAPPTPAALSSQGRPVRARAQRKSGKPLATVIERTDDTLVIAIKVDSNRLANERRKQRRRERDRQRRAAKEKHFVTEEVSHYPTLPTASFAQFYAFRDKDGEEVKSKPYGGILSELEADTSKTFPQLNDRKKFEDARLKAEADWKKKLEEAAAAEPPRPAQKVSGPPSKIKCINFGGYEIDTWHAAPYPEEYSRNKVLYICEFCLKYMNSDFVAWRHKLKCPAKHPPGDEIYRDGSFSFFEVDGRKNPVYCQNLCLLAKLFLGSKTLYYDVEPFLFYVMTENDEYGCHFVGYFSKEKRPSSQNNVSCILVLPIHQRRGFGHMLIDFSYLLTKTEKKTGSPEKPLSDMGLVSYRSYWRLILCQELLAQKDSLSVSDISDRTGMTADDIVCALEGLRALVRDPVTRTYALRLDLEYFRNYIDKYERKGYAKIDPGCLMWTPYVMGKDNSHYENTPHISTVAQRDEDGDIDGEAAAQLAAGGVSEKDYGNGEVEGKEMITPAEESSNPLLESAEPFPALQPDLTASKRSPRKLESVEMPTIEELEAPIPAFRFEIFPPVPGLAAIRKRGRPPISSRSARRVASFAASPTVAGRHSSLRQSRSTGLDGANEHDNDKGEEDDDPDAEGDPDEPDAEGDADGEGDVDVAMEDIDAEGDPE